METKSIKKTRIGKWLDRVQLYWLAKSFGYIIALGMGIKTRERMSHNNGIGARGIFTMKPDPRIPKHAFIEDGKVFPCRIRHAAATFYDDAMSVIRSLSVKLSDNEFESPFDLNLNTGSISLFWNASSFSHLAKMRRQKYGIEYQDYYKRYPIGKEGAISTLRRNPTSYSNLIYYAKTPFNFVGEDGIQRYAKYRAIPYEELEETGIISGRDVLEPENQRITPGETRSRNYLKDEFKERLANESVRYRLQIQIREHKDDQDPIIFNCCVDWDDQEFPWMDMGIIQVDKIMDWTSSNRMGFSVINMPKNLDMIKAYSIYDYNSLNYMRAKTEVARKARLWAYKVWGNPVEIPDSDNRNSSTIV